MIKNNIIDLQAQYDKLAKSKRGGCIVLKAKVYPINQPLRIHSNKVKIIGQGKDLTILYAPTTNAIEIENNAYLNLEALSVVTKSFEAMCGTGIYVPPDTTADIRLHQCAFRTTLGALTYRNHPKPIGLGNIEITYCDFMQSCINPRIANYPTNYHKVLLWGKQEANKRFNVSFNYFAKHPKQRNNVIELAIWGDSSYGKGKGPMTLINGHVMANTFNGATRECLSISDHQKFIVKDNIINDSNRVGLYVIRGYRSIISNNIVHNSRYRGHRIAHLEDCIWVGNACYNTGIEDNANVKVGGMHVTYSFNNVVANNVILSSQGHAIAINNGSQGNKLYNNMILGKQQSIFVDKDTNDNQIV